MSTQSTDNINAAGQAPQLSICVINWNGKAMLRGLLQSIQEHRAEVVVEVLVADNASQDGSPDMVAQEFPWVILFRNTQNLGAAKGYNQGVDAASAPLVLLINNDTLIRRGALQTLVKFMNENPDVVAVGPKLIGGDGEPQRTGRNLPTLGALMNYIQLVRWTGLFKRAYRTYRHADFDANKPADYEQLSASAMVVRRESYLRYPFDVGYRFGIEDVDFCARVRADGKIYYLPSAEIVHLGRISSRANRGFAYLGFECGWARYLRKFRGRGTAILYKTLVTLDMPLRLLSLGIQLMLYKLTHRTEKAQRTRDILRAAWEFFTTGLPDFWRA